MEISNLTHLSQLIVDDRINLFEFFNVYPSCVFIIHSIGRKDPFPGCGDFASRDSEGKTSALQINLHKDCDTAKNVTMFAFPVSESMSQDRELFEASINGFMTGHKLVECDPAMSWQIIPCDCGTRSTVACVG